MTQQGQTTTTSETTTQGAKAQGQGAKKQGQATAKQEKPAKKPREKKERPARETPAHMPKVEKQAASLPQMSQDVQTLHAAAINLSTADILAFVAHLNIAVRRRGVQQAAALNAQSKDNPSKQLVPGARVKIVTSQNTRFIGLEGTVTKVQRIRCYVALDGREYSVKEDGKGNKFTGDYFFTSDVVQTSASQQELSNSLAETVARLTQSAPATSLDALMDDEEEEAATGTNG